MANIITKPKGIFLLDQHIREMVYGLEEQRELHALANIPDVALSPADIDKCPELLREAEVIFSSWGAPRLDAAFLDKTPRLKAFFFGAGSVKAIATEEFWKRDIQLTSASAANAIPVAEFAHAQVILSLKRTWWYARELRGCESWPVVETRVPGTYGSTVGLVSLGAIGRLVLEKLAASEVNVIAHDPYIAPDAARKLHVEMVSMEELFARSDVVSIHTPLLKETEGFIGRRLLSCMKKNATFINTARGKLVNERELCEVLRERPDLFAVLDVSWPEPAEKGSPLYSLPNVVLTPHISGSRDNECLRLGRYMVEELKRYLAGEPMRYQVSPLDERISA